MQKGQPFSTERFVHTHGRSSTPHFLRAPPPYAACHTVNFAMGTVKDSELTEDTPEKLAS